MADLNDLFLDEEGLLGRGGECSSGGGPASSMGDDDEIRMTQQPQHLREENDQEIVADFILRRRTSDDDSIMENDSPWRNRRLRQQQPKQPALKLLTNEIDVDTLMKVVDVDALVAHQNNKSKATTNTTTTTATTTTPITRDKTLEAGKIGAADGGGGGGERGRASHDDDSLPLKRRPEMEYDEAAWQPDTTPRKAAAARSHSIQEKLDMLDFGGGGGEKAGSTQGCGGDTTANTDPNHTATDFAGRKTGRRRCQGNGESPQPGAYAGAPGQSLTRSLSPRYSLVGIQARLILEEEEQQTAEMCDTSTSEADPSLSKDPSCMMDLETGGGDHEEGLAVAVPAQRPSQLPEAMEVDSAAIQKANNNKKGTRRRRVVCGVIAAIVVVISLFAVVATLVTTAGSNDEDSAAFTTTEHPSMSPSESPTDRLPPMDNLEILFGSLADNARQSLMDDSTSQWKAWDWLLNHQNITNLPEWRKQQLFALATFYHSFEGPMWPQEIRKHWLNDTMDECSWINTSLRYLYGISATYLRSLTFDFNPCNAEGEYQTIALIYLKLARANPVMPPEIALLPNLAHLILALSEIQAPLSDIIVPEVYQLSNLDMFVLHGNSISGSLPEDIGNLTSPRYLLFGTNSITGTIPTEVGLLTSRLWDLDLHVNNIRGTIPSELGQLTMVTSLTLNENSLEGSIPDQIGKIPTMLELQLDGNSLTGAIPSSLGLLTLMKRLQLQGNQLSGSIPSQISQLPALKDLGLTDLPLLSGEIPNDLCWLQANHTSCFVFESNGALPDSYMCSLSFDCSDLLCGCDCPCSNTSQINNGTYFPSL